MQSEQDCPTAENVYPLSEESTINLNDIILLAFQYLFAKIVLCSYLVKRCPSKDVDGGCEKQRHLEICYFLFAIISRLRYSKLREIKIVRQLFRFKSGVISVDGGRENRK